MRSHWSEKRTRSCCLRVFVGLLVTGPRSVTQPTITIPHPQAEWACVCVCVFVVNQYSGSAPSSSALSSAAASPLQNMRSRTLMAVCVCMCMCAVPVFLSPSHSGGLRAVNGIRVVAGALLSARYRTRFEHFTCTNTSHPSVCVCAGRRRRENGTHGIFSIQFTVDGVVGGSWSVGCCFNGRQLRARQTRSKFAREHTRNPIVL